MAFLVWADIELDALALIEGAVAVHLDRRVVHENVSTIFEGDEAVALVAVEPLHGSGRCHVAPISPAMPAAGGIRGESRASSRFTSDASGGGHRRADRSDMAAT